MTDAAASLRELSEPWAGGEKVKRAIERAAKRASLSYWRAFDIWYGKARKIEQFEIDAIAEAIDTKRREAARNELHELRSRLERFESLLAQIDPDFHRNTIAQTRQQLRAMGRARGVDDSAVD
jgi:hypothetical protein